MKFRPELRRFLIDKGDQPKSDHEKQKSPAAPGMLIHRMQELN
jgi:hypothetical protein